jgi:hypothetical protein
MAWVGRHALSQSLYEIPLRMVVGPGRESPRTTSEEDPSNTDAANYWIDTRLQAFRQPSGRIR